MSVYDLMLAYSFSYYRLQMECSDYTVNVTWIPLTAPDMKRSGFVKNRNVFVESQILADFVKQL